MLVIALSLSAIAAFYSIVGLAAIFSAAVIPIVVMGSILECAKLVVTVWLHEYWNQCRLLMKIYLVPAVGVLMLITSMGIFGFLSKAHLDQNVISGESTTKIAIYDEKIKSAKDNIETNRRALKQMDDAVDQTMSRTTDEQGATKAANLRRSQQAERSRLQNEIAKEQQKIQQLNEERAPIAAEVRKVEAEVGPIKYVASLIYGDNPDANLLERAVRWVIIILVIVFDPLAIVMLLAFTESYKWEKSRRQLQPTLEPSGTEVFMGQVSDQVLSWRDRILEKFKKEPPVDPPQEPIPPVIQPEPEPQLEPVVTEPTPEPMAQQQWGGQDLSNRLQPGEPAVEPPKDDSDLSEEDKNDPEKIAKRMWKVDNPQDTLKRHEKLFDQGKIGELPWDKYLQLAEDVDGINSGFGTQFPDTPNKGDLFIRVDYLPTKLFKWNGAKWIEVEKQITDTFSYNNDYIDHLINKIATGEYDPDLLSDTERQQIEERLKTK